MEIKQFCSDVFIPSIVKAGGLVGAVWALAEATGARDENSQDSWKVAYFAIGILALGWSVHRKWKKRTVLPILPATTPPPSQSNSDTAQRSSS